ncbi:MAG: hypothetical protein WEB04_08375 [Dehalococcoidia bacterium]
MSTWLKSIGISATAVVVAALLATGIVSISVGGTSAGAQESDSSTSAVPPRVLPSLIAAAIGQLTEDDGETATVDLRGTIRDGKPGGALRFYSEEYGYYNGGVRTLTVDDAGLIHASGNGGLVQPDGTRVAVHHDATFAPDGTSSIHVRGRDLDYTLEGTLDGLVQVWEPPTAG